MFQPGDYAMVPLDSHCSVGGRARPARKLWQDYFAEIDGVVFLVDALDQGRFQEAKAELDVSATALAFRLILSSPTSPPPRARPQALLTTDVLQGVPFLILGNKIDLPLAASEPQLRDALGLHDTTGKEV